MPGNFSPMVFLPQFWENFVGRAARKEMPEPSEGPIFDPELAKSVESQPLKCLYFNIFQLKYLSEADLFTFKSFLNDLKSCFGRPVLRFEGFRFAEELGLAEVLQRVQRDTVRN